MRYPLALKLQPSRRLLYLIAAIHLVAAIASALSAVERALLVPFALLLAVSWWRALHAERQKGKWLLVLDESGLIRLDGPGGERTGRPLPACADFGWAVWVSWRPVEGETSRRPAPASFMLFPDSVPAESWRPLRTWLRHKAMPTPSDSVAGRHDP